MSKYSIYADHAATSPLSPAAREAMLPYLAEEYGNPSTLYSLARKPRKAVNAARESIARAIGALPEEIIFTSGGSESDNLAIKGTAFKRYGAQNRIITTAIEHHAVLNAARAMERFGFDTQYISNDRCGRVSKDELSIMMGTDVALVSIMLANNEIGTIQPIQDLAQITHQTGALFHTDAVQAVGHIPIDVKKLGVDMLSASAHKFNGPKGVGFLYLRKGIQLIPLVDGGGQERGMRGGTENVAGIVGMAAALKEHTENMEVEKTQLRLLQIRLIDELNALNLDYMINGGNDKIPGNVSISFAGASGEMLLHRLDLMGIAVATGSACNSKETQISHVIRAIGVPEDYAEGTIRISFGPENTVEEAAIIARCIAKILRSNAGT